jgi:PhnB protein
MQLNPYLLFDGQCEEALRFYERVLGGRVADMLTHEGTPMESQVPPEWRTKILHARLLFGDRELMASDAPPGRYVKPQGFSVTLQIPDPAEAERVFGALSDGAHIQMPLQRTFWASRFGMLVDRFGTPWMVNCDQAA